MGYGMFMKVKGAIDRGRPGVDERIPWPPLSIEQQAEMDQAVAMLREAAEQGHMMAQGACANTHAFWLGHGERQPPRVRVHQKGGAARTSWESAQYRSLVLSRQRMRTELRARGQVV